MAVGFGELPRLINVISAEPPTLTGCDGFRIYTNRSYLQGVSDHSRCTDCVEKAIHGSMTVPHGWGGALNTRIFIQVWNHVVMTGVHTDYHWVVKTEVDVVFMGSRLVRYLALFNHTVRVTLVAI